MPGTPPNPTPIYHITHIDNLPGIVEAGGLHSNREALARGSRYTDIGNREIKSDRNSTPIAAGPGGVVGDYVPFYFAPRSPMLFVISRGGVVGYDGGEEAVVYLLATAQRVAAAGLAFAFTDGHARVGVSQAFDTLHRLDAVDWPVMQSRYWNDTPDAPDRKRRRQAEFLVHRTMPLQLVDGIAVKNATMAGVVQRILDRANLRIQIRVQADWYYG